jgi:hypothetical protein
MGIIDDLLEHPGLYLGVDTVADSDRRGAARMVVTPLPGRSGVTLDYEILNGLMPDQVRGHVEHTVVARAQGGATVMIVADTHASVVTTLVETSPGVFEPGPEGSPYPMRVGLTMTEPGVLRHSWAYGRPGDEPVERDVSVVRLAPA